uniref:Gnk2-homologous domain-containing protein n=1 Tax=Leersia perrieri TaxID=77586 RepID=A0A0D9V6F0_9ORYZ
MALTKLSTSFVLIQLLVVGAMSSAANGSFFPQIDCSPPPITATTTMPSTRNGTRFRANLLKLLADLPDAAAKTGFASTAAGVHDGDRAFARGLCIGDGDGDTTPDQCRDCLAAAAMDVVATCGAASRRAGAWLPGCYLAYADTNTTSPDERGFHRWLVSGNVLPFSDNARPTFLDLSSGVVAAAARSASPRMMATQAFDDGAGATGLAGRVLAQCAPDRGAAECAQCLRDAARVMPGCCSQAQGRGESVAVVLSYDCVLQFDMHLASSSAPWAWIIFGTLCALLALTMGAVLGIILCVLIRVRGLT